MFTINRAPFLKEFMVSNPPQFKISNKCCDYAKKKSSAEFQKEKEYDLCCVGVRKSEGGCERRTKPASRILDQLISLGLSFG